VLVLDEPFAGLDTATAQQIRIEVQALPKTVLLISHTTPDAKMGGTVLTMQEGRMQQAPAAAL